MVLILIKSKYQKKKNKLLFFNTDYHIWHPKNFSNFQLLINIQDYSEKSKRFNKENTRNLLEKTETALIFIKKHLYSLLKCIQSAQNGCKNNWDVS